MPIYTYRCPCGASFDRWLPVARYAEPQACDCGQVAVKQLCAPAIHADLPGYVSPASGRWIEGRRAREEDLKRTGSRPWEGIDAERQEAARQREYQLQKTDAIVEACVERAAAESGLAP